MKNELLEILAQNCRITNAQIAVMLGIEEEDVADMIKILFWDILRL
jgi:DNA-binding Lrp family transcriptional regulator